MAFHCFMAFIFSVEKSIFNLIWRYCIFSPASFRIPSLYLIFIIWTILKILFILMTLKVLEFVEAVLYFLFLGSLICEPWPLLFWFMFLIVWLQFSSVRPVVCWISEPQLSAWSLPPLKLAFDIQFYLIWEECLLSFFSISLFLYSCFFHTSRKTFTPGSVLQWP